MRITDTHVYFFTSKDIFSNFAKTPFIYERKSTDMLGEHITRYELACSEQGYMLEKCLYFNQIELYEKCIITTDPKTVKLLGRKIPNFDSEKWDKVKFDIMYKVCLAKYFNNIEAKQALLNTDNKILVEASPFDITWGCGYSKYDDSILLEKNWTGENRLGEILMKIREEIKNNI